MHQRRHTRKLTSILALAAALAGCRDVTAPATTAPPNGDREALKRLGFPADLARDVGDHYVIDGDIIVRKSDLARGGLRPRRPEFQYAVDNVADSTWHYAPVNVYFGDLEAANADWGAPVRQAIAVWSTVPGTKIPLFKRPADPAPTS
jgi:hypothetical protein